MTFAPGDERRHAPGPEPAWAETWVFDLWDAHASVGAFTWLTLLPNQRRAWYWAVLARDGEPQLYVADTAVPLPSNGLRVRTTGLWADHVCEVPFEQWTVQNECHAVALDDPADALGRAYGQSTPIAMDVEWYASALAEPADGGYHQRGEAHAVIELAGGPLELVVPAARAHWWGAIELSGADTVEAEGLRAYLPTESLVLERVLTSAGWQAGITRPQ